MIVLSRIAARKESSCGEDGPADRAQVEIRMANSNNDLCLHVLQCMMTMSRYGEVHSPRGAFWSAL